MSVARYLVSAMLLVAGVIHLLPLSGALGVERLAALYGVSLAEPNLVLLMRHRAVLFGLLGLLLVWSAFKPALQPVAFIAGFASVLSFMWLALPLSLHNAEISRVFMVDLGALGCLALGAAAYAYARRTE